MQIVSENNNKAPEITKKSNRKTDYAVLILVLQMITVGIIVCTAFILKLTGGKLYLKVRDIYRLKVDDETNVHTVLDDDGGRIYKSVTDTELTGENTSEYDAEYVMKAVEVSSCNGLIQPVIGTVTSEYGYRIHPISKKYAMHSGIDFAADTGTEVKCAYDGEVIEADYSSSYGNYLKVKHNDNFVTVYAHCSKLLASAGDKVVKGESIALVGSTGVSTGPHLHFEVIICGEKVDPRWLLPTVCEV